MTSTAADPKATMASGILAVVPAELVHLGYPGWDLLTADEIVALVEHLTRCSPIHAAAVWQSVQHRLSHNSRLYVPLMCRVTAAFRLVDEETLEVLEHTPLPFRMQVALEMNSIPSWWTGLMSAPALELVLGILLELDPDGAGKFWQSVQSKFEGQTPVAKFRTTRRYLLEFANRHKIPRIKVWQLERANWVADLALQWLADDGYTLAITVLNRHLGEPQVQVVVKDGSREIVFVQDKDARYQPSFGVVVVFRRGDVHQLGSSGRVFAAHFAKVDDE